MRVKGITRRWIVNNLGLTVVILTTLILIISLIMKRYFYSGIQQTLSGRSNELANIFRGHSSQTPGEFNDAARAYVEAFPDKALMELMIFDDHDRTVITSVGFVPETTCEAPDYNNAMLSDDGFGLWTGFILSGEKVMAVTRRIYAQNGRYLGAIRYVVSLEEADSRIFFSAVVLISLSVLIVMFVVLSGMYFIKSIVNPVMEIGTTAKLIAHGNFTIKIDKKYDDEIGELCDTVNYMAEELGTAERMKNDFISSVSHEIRTPLTAIKGWAETMQLGDSIDQSVIKRGLDIIVHETERLSGIVEELLDFSRLQGGRMVLSVNRIDILAELGEAVYIFKQRAATEKKSLIYNEPKMLSPIMGDRNRLRQVFINIIDNAIKYTSEGGGISISVSEKDATIYVSVTDNGCGIASKHLSRVTEKFYKANTTHRGSGIGLAIATEIVALHGGSFEILSEEGFGTTVNITFPAMVEETHSDEESEVKTTLI